MKKTVKAGILAILILMLGVSDAAAHFGSKVEARDFDCGRHLEDFTLPLSLGFWDTGANPGYYDALDVVYLDVEGNYIVDVNDIRLTQYERRAAGCKVTAMDNDVGITLDPLPGYPIFMGIYYTDISGTSAGYDLQDPVYLLVTGASTRVSIDDIRLTSVNRLAAGTKVQSFHPDYDRPAVPMVIPVVPSINQGPVASIRFYNANCNVNQFGYPIYDSPDDIYLDIPWTDEKIVTPNDLRLSG